MVKSNKPGDAAIAGILIVCFIVSGFIPRKSSPLEWLRANLQTVKSECNSFDIVSGVTKTYTFYDSAFVIKTEKEYQDKDLNGPAYFSKVYYHDIMWKDSLTVSQSNEIIAEECLNIKYYKIDVHRLYTAAGREPAEGGKWFTLGEANALTLYLPPDESLSLAILTRLRQLTMQDY